MPHGRMPSEETVVVTWLDSIPQEAVASFERPLRLHNFQASGSSYKDLTVLMNNLWSGYTCKLS